MLAGMMPALMHLSADTRKRGPADTILAVKIMNDQVTSSELIINFLHTITGNAPDRFLPIVLIGVAEFKSGFALVDLSGILYSFKSGFCLERQLRQM